MPPKIPEIKIPEINLSEEMRPEETLRKLGVLKSEEMVRVEWKGGAVPEIPETPVSLMLVTPDLQQNAEARIVELNELGLSRSGFRNRFANPSLPEARLLPRRIEGEGVESFEDLLPTLWDALGSQGIVLGGILVVALWSPMIAATGFAAFLIHKVGKKLSQNFRGLSSGSYNRQLLSGTPILQPSTYRKDEPFLKRVEEIRSKGWSEMALKASEGQMSTALYLSRALKAQKAPEVEAWVEVMFGESLELKIEWIGLAKNKSGIPLLQDIMLDTSLDPLLRKKAIAVLADMKSEESIPLLKDLLSELSIARAAGGALMFLDPSEEMLGEVMNSPLPKGITTSWVREQREILDVWTEAFFEISKLKSLLEKSVTYESVRQLLLKADEKGFDVRLLVREVTRGTSYKAPLLSIFRSLRIDPQLIIRPVYWEIARGMIEGGEPDGGLRPFWEAYSPYYQVKRSLDYYLYGILPEQVRPIVSWAYCFEQIGFPTTVLSSFVRQIKRDSLKLHPQTQLLLFEASPEIAEPFNHLPILVPLLSHEDMEIAFKAAELMDRFQPGWDEIERP